MSATQDYVALEWIRGELTKTLENAQVALEAVAQTPDDTTSMRSCLTAIHQVHGTLKMVQLSGPAQMAAEMEQLAQSLMNSTVADIPLAQETLMQAILQLPAYLDRLHREQKDSERNYLPMVNNLRTVRGEERIPGSEGTSLEDRGPDLGPLGVVPTDKVTNAYFQADGEGNLPKIRARYQQSLNAILKKSKVRENLTTLGKLFTMLIRLCGESPMGNLSQLGLGVIEGVANGGIKLDNRTASLLQSVDEELKKLGDAGKNGLSAPINDPLGIGLIGLVNGAQKETKRIAGLKKLYAVEAPVPEVVAIGPDDETLSTVAKILIEELAAITDKLDIYVRSQDRDSEDLVALIPNLEQISSTMVVLGNSEQQATVLDQITAIRQLESGGEPSEETLLSMAQALLQIEASLGLLVIDSEGDHDSFANLDEAQAAVITETRVALSTAKDAVIDFISSDFDHTRITDLPSALKALRGGLMIANQRRAGDVLEAAAHYVDRAILANKVTPGLDQMDDLADAITSVDYFLERLLENAEDPYLQMLEVAESSVAKLGYAVGEAPAAEVVEAPAAELVEEPAAELVEAPAAEIEAADPLDSSAAAEVIVLPEDDLDEDILPIFLEEAEELLEELDQSILGWAESGKPGQYLDNLLRQLHTLKGGARMAGAASLGEYAHNFETLLIGIQSNPVEFDDNFFAILNAQQDEITRRVEIYQKVATASASQEELESLRTASNTGTGAAPSSPPVEPTEAEVPVTVPAVVSAGVDTVVELPADKIDDDVLPIFLEESDELIDELESSIQSWSESPARLDTLDVLLRNLHTLKGGARMAGLNSLGEYAHNFETFLNGIQQKPVELDDDFFALLNQRQDEVIRRVEIYKKLSVGAATQEDLQSLQSALEPRLETDPVHSPETSVESEPESAEDQPPQAPKPASANQEMVRVSADLLEQLIGLAGESSITRGRVEQQIADFGEFLQEMEDTITRIRNQVRLLEIEAESRETLIRSRQTTESESSFDELEMDRYTMLQAISRALNEGSSDMMDLKDTLTNRSRDAEALLHQQARISGELQEGLTRTIMVPFARLIPRLRRIVRQISGEVGKLVRFDAYNVEGELDRNVLERIVAPLEHMLRNAVDHGIEEKQARVAAGKEEQGRISLRLYREGGYVVLNVSDDGAGINVDAVRAKAVERGLITEAQEISDHEVMQFIMHAGFSTAQKLTQISGRGVGMDVVDSEIKSLGGSVTIDSTFGVGTEFTIRIPFTVSINRALMVVVKDETYAVPLNTIEGIVRVSPYELEAYYQPDAPMFEYAGQPYRLAYIGKMLDKSVEHSLEGHVAPLPVILARSGDHAVALQVDRVIGSREVVVKTLGPQYGDVGGISGATLLGDGSVVIILDCMALVRSYEAGVESGEQVTIEPVAEEVRDVRTIMIVDDSVTVRKVTSRLMERQGFEVVTAKDGIDAMNQLEEIRPDVMLLDIEMPRMDGFEVLRSVRHNEQLQDLPIIMITSRTGEKHKQQAMELGVNHYLGKPFQEASLLATIEEVIEKAKAKLQPN